MKKWHAEVPVIVDLQLMRFADFLIFSSIAIQLEASALLLP